MIRIAIAAEAYGAVKATLPLGTVAAQREGRTRTPFGDIVDTFPISVSGVDPKAMLVILTTPEEIEAWLEADIGEAAALQRSLPDVALRIVAKGEKEDRSPEFQL